MRMHTVAMVLLASLCVFQPVTAEENSAVRFLEKPSLEAAKEQAKKEGRWIYVLVSSKSCGACTYMKEHIFPKPYFARMLNMLFVPVLASVQTQEGKAIARNFSEKGYPRAYMLDRNGKRVGYLLGACTYYDCEACRILRQLDLSKSQYRRLAKELKEIAPKRSLPNIDDSHLLAFVFYHAGYLKTVAKLYGPERISDLNTAERKNTYAAFWACDVGGNFDSALEMAKESVAEDPQAFNLDTLAACYAAKGEYQVAVRYQKEAIAKQRRKDPGYQKRLEEYEAKLKD